MTLDDVLVRSGPPVTPPSPEVMETLREMAASNEVATRPRRRRGTRALAAGSLAIVGVVGVGGVAAAHGLLPGWFPWAAESGSSCGLQVSVDLRRDGDGALITDRTSNAEQRATLRSARQYLKNLDVDAIDRNQAAEHWFTYMERTSANHPDRAALESKFQGERLETHSILYEVDTRLDDYLTAHGHDPRSIMTTMANECGQ